MSNELVRDLSSDIQNKRNKSESQKLIEQLKPSNQPVIDTNQNNNK